MECINCGKENEWRSKYCSNTCKTQYHRNQGTHVEAVQTVSEGTVSTPDSEVGQAHVPVVLDPAKCADAAYGIDRTKTVGERGKLTPPPCITDQLTSSCLACKDKPTCSYLHNMNSAVPGDPEYAGVI